jgi:D-alanyl-D-alanine carboxypeptidase
VLMTRRAALAAGVGLVLAPGEAVGALSNRGLARGLRDHCERLAREDGFSGAVLLMRNGRTLFQCAYGMRNRGEALPNFIDTKFNIASIGKLFTSLAIMRFVEAGQLRLDARLIEAWPEYPNREVAERITIAQILTHTAGLGNAFLFKPKTGFTATSSHTDYMRLFVDEPLSGEPGAEVAYSNDGYVLLGALIERLSDRGYREHCAATIFAPLGMSGTGFFSPDDIVSNIALPYVRDLQHPGVWRAALASDGLPGSAAGGAYSTVGDLARFTEAVSANRLLSAELTCVWTQGRVVFRNGQYGYGVQTESINGHRIFGHSGGHYGVAGEVMVFEDTGHIVLALSNGEVEPFWDLASFVRSEIVGESDASRNYRFTRMLIDSVSMSGPEVGLALCAANPERAPRESVIEVYAFRAWHSGDAAGAENLLRFNVQKFPDSLSALWSIAELYRYAQRNADAVAAYHAFLDRQPDDADALSYIEQLGG